MPMIDPLSHFNWHTLYQGYDELAWRYNPNIEYLDIFNPRPQSLRDCYLGLCAEVASELSTGGDISVATYTAITYWKLYFLPLAIASICGTIRNDEACRERLRPMLHHFSDEFGDQDPPKDPGEIIDLIHLIGEFEAHGMKSDTALPTRATFLHFVYPTVVPIFDKQVLLAVGIDDDGANHDIEVLREYIPFAWDLAATYKNDLPEEYPETPLRLIDMALWVTRDNNP